MGADRNAGSLETLGSALRRRELTCTELAQAALKRIGELEPQVNAFITVTADAALEQAKARDRELRAGIDRGPLHGIPIAYKDCLDTAGVRTTVGSRYFGERVPAADAAVVARLGEAGAVMLGKSNMNEFAAGTSGKNAFYGDVRNPWALERSAGGSSSGTAAAVAAGMALAGVGTDAGGSIRLPAACTGIVGMRPTRGLVPVEGCFPRSFSLDVVGPLARAVRDCAAMLQAMARPPDDYLAGIDAGVAGVRIGVVADFTFRDVDPQVGAALGAALDRLAARGAEIREIPVRSLSGASDHAAPVDIMLYEFHRVLGEQFRACADPEQVFGPVVCANLRRGMTIDEASYREALALQAERTTAIRAAFAQADALVTPVLALPTPRLDAPAAEFDRQRRFMIPFSAAGCPALSIPCGADRDALPIGMQIVGDRLREGLLFRIAQAFESASGWSSMQWGANTMGGGS